MNPSKLGEKGNDIHNYRTNETLTDRPEEQHKSMRKALKQIQISFTHHHRRTVSAKH